MDYSKSTENQNGYMPYRTRILKSVNPSFQKGICMHVARLKRKNTEKKNQ